MEKLNPVPPMGQSLAKRLMNEIPIKVIPDFEELEDIKKRKEEKRWKNTIDIVIRLFVNNNIATTLREDTDKLVSETGIKILLDYDLSLPKDIDINDVRSVTEYVLQQKGYNATAKADPEFSNSCRFFLTIKKG